MQVIAAAKTKGVLALFHLSILLSPKTLSVYP